jgi:hypothetical protein
MVNCERCKEKITLDNSYIFHDTASGEIKKFCQSCAVIIRTHTEEKRSIMRQKEIEDAFYKITEEPVQKIEKLSKPESESLTMKDMKTERTENHEMNETVDVFPSNVIVEKINSYLNDKPLNIGKGDYCYIRIVRNHLEIGRVKIILED